MEIHICHGDGQLVCQACSLLNCDFLVPDAAWLLEHVREHIGAEQQIDAVPEPDRTAALIEGLRHALDAKPLTADERSFPVVREVAGLVAELARRDGNVTTLRPSNKLYSTLLRGHIGPAVDTAVDFLRHALSGGPVLFVKLESDAAARGISLMSLRRAKHVLGVVAQPLRQVEGRKVRAWQWSLPSAAA